MEKVEYKITEDEDFKGKLFKSYTVEKHITYDNGTKEVRTRVVFPHLDGEPTIENLSKLKFSKSIEPAEWEQLPEIYRKAWLNGTMTDELYKYGETCLAIIRAGFKNNGGVADVNN